MNSFLIDGPLMSIFDRRREMIESMAKDLVAGGEGLLCDSDAMQILRHKGYAMVDVAILAGEARMVAMQEIVAQEMSDQ